MRPSLTFEDIAKARSVIADQVHRTPVLSRTSPWAGWQDVNSC